MLVCKSLLDYLNHKSDLIQVRRLKEIELFRLITRQEAVDLVSGLSLIIL